MNQFSRWWDAASLPLVDGNAEMIRINGHYLYQIGSQIHPLTSFGQNTSMSDAYLPLIVAEGALEPLLTRSVFGLKTSVESGVELLKQIRTLRDQLDKAGDGAELIGAFSAYLITNAANRFEAVLAAELGLTDLYYVMKKRGYDTMDLVEYGDRCFPSDLGTKVPDAIGDVKQATKCIAFELPTAAGFHLHRANESVLHAYYDAVSNGAARPNSRNMGDYLAEMNSKGYGDPIVRSSLKDLKDLHRNPLIHPEHSLESIDEAIALMGSVIAVMVPMLKVIPEVVPPPPPATAPGGGLVANPGP